MNERELRQILDKHQEWINGEGGEFANLRYADLSGADLNCADLSCANLSGADLNCANLRDADLDYAALKLNCDTLHLQIDDRTAIQFVYHTLSNALGSANTSDRVKSILSAPELIELANEFHRVGECGKLEGAKTDADK